MEYDAFHEALDIQRRGKDEESIDRLRLEVVFSEVSGTKFFDGRMESHSPYFPLKCEAPVLVGHVLEHIQRGQLVAGVVNVPNHAYLDIGRELPL